MSHLENDIDVIDLYYSTLEPLVVASTIFNKWFGIPFIDTTLITHVRGPTSVKILRICHISDIYNQCISLFFFERALRFTLLHIPSLEVVRYIVDSLVHFLSIICLPNPAFLSMYNWIINLPIPTNFIWTLQYS